MKTLRKQLNTLLVAAVATSTLLISQASAEETYGIRAFYGDRQMDRVVIIDVDNMTLDGEVYTTGVDPYPVDQAGSLDKVYAITRSSNSIDVIDASTMEPIGLIELQHYPRSSEAFNPALGLQLVTGADKPMASLIDVQSDSVVAVVGEDTLVSPIDYGGSNATGHPFWFSDDTFALIDRGSRSIKMFKIKKGQGKHGRWKTHLVDEVATPTAVHHFVKRDLSLLSGIDAHTYYALSEGAPEQGISPAILKFVIKKGQLNLVAEAPLATTNIENMGSHHADLHPNGQLIYVGSTEGNVYIINIKKMVVVRKIAAGLGAGHTTFVPERNIAIVTNHKDKFVTIIDTIRHQKIKDVVVSGDGINDEILQSHSSFVHPNMNFFYAFATDNGIFYELDLETLEVSRTLKTEGTPLQGVFMCQGAECENLM